MPDDKIEIIVEDSEEVPTSVERKIKVLEMPVFTEQDKKNVQNMIDRLDKFISEVYSERASIGVLREELSSLRDEIRLLAEKRTDSERIAGVLHADMKNVESAIDMLAKRPSGDERIVNFIDRAVRSIEALAQSLNDTKLEIREAFNERLGVMDNKVEEKLYALDSTISYMKGLIIDLSEKISSASTEGVSDTKFTLFVENMSEKFDAYMANLNNRLDNLVLQVIEPINDLSVRLEELKSGAGTDEIKKLLANVEDAAGNVNLLNDTVSKTSKKFEKSVKAANKKVDAVTKKVAGLEKNLQKSVAEIKKKDSELKVMLRDVQRINLRLSKMDNAEFLLRVIEARRKVAAKAARLTREEKVRVSKSLEAIENDLVDLSIIALLKKKKMNITMLSRSILASDKKIRERVRVLTNANRIKKERLGRYFVYSVVQ